MQRLAAAATAGHRSPHEWLVTTLDTHPFRVWLLEYVVVHGLDQAVPAEQGFDPAAHGPLHAPGQHLCKRVQRNMMAANELARHHHKPQPYPGVEETGILDEATREALTPDRPSFEDAFRRIAQQDDRLDGEEYYTQGAMRWQGVAAIFGKVKVSKGLIPKLRGGDCSSGYTRWVLWGLQQNLGRVPRDIVNGADWRAGYTGSIYRVCRRVVTPRIGDAILYPNHVTGVFDVAARTCVSHGVDRAEIVPWDNHRGRYSGFWRPAYGNA